MVNIIRSPFAFWIGAPDPAMATIDFWGGSSIPFPLFPGNYVSTLSTARQVVKAASLSAATPSAPAPTQVTSATSPMVINLDWDASVSAAPAGFMTDVIAAAHYLESQFSNAVTLTFNVGYNEVAGNSVGGALGESLSNLNRVSYVALRTAVTTSATTLTDVSVAGSLPVTSPVSGANFWVTTAQQKALGLSAANGTGVDGSVGFGTSSLFSYGDTATSGTVASGTYDFFATVVHELTEVMGRQLLTGITEAGFVKSYTLMDLLHYSAAGARTFSASNSGYFSADGGITSLGAFNTLSGGDAGDWASSVRDDPFDAFATPGVLEPVSANDLTVLDAIGWNASGGGTQAQSPPAPTGVAAAAVRNSLASAQVNKGLAAKAALATFNQAGGPAGDTFLYALGGAGAGSFSLVSASNIATLSVGASPILAAKASGALFALTVTATDVTTGLSSPAVPVNLVVGGNGNDIIHVSSLPGVTNSAPTFIYGLGGINTLDGTGMAGVLCFDSGTGADMMTGGGGGNVFEYGAAADSTASAMDIITNFNVAVDLIDLTGIGIPFNVAAALSPSATSIASGAIGWRVSGGNTFVYANASNQPQALPSASMKIELLGNVAVTAANFAHL